MALNTRVPIGRQDLGLFDGKNPTFQRPSNTGGIDTLLTIGGDVDILTVYGGGFDRSDKTIQKAINAVGDSAVAFSFAPGNWNISADISFPKNIYLKPSVSALFHIAFDKIMLIYSPSRFIVSPSQQIHGNPLTGGKLKFLKPGKVPVSWYGDNTSSSSIQLAVNGIDAGEIEFNTEQHTISISDGIGVRIDKSNLKFTSTCRTEFIHDGSDIDGLWFDIGAESSDDSFVQVHDITFDGLVMTGSATGTSTTQAAIYAKAHSDTYTAGTDGSYNITVTNCKITGFTMSVYLIGAHKIDIGPNNEMGDNVFIPAASAGGYGVIAETTYDLKVHHNDFISTTEDRHAVYISTDGSKTGADVQGHNVQITNNFIDWSNTVLGTDGSREAISVHETHGFLATENTIRGSMQYGMVFTFNNGDGSDYIITENIITDVRIVSVSSGGGILFNRNATYMATNVIIKNNTITEASAGNTADFRGIQMSGKSGATEINATIGGNIIVAEESGSIGILLTWAKGVIIEPNHIDLKSTARSGIAFANTCDNIRIHKQNIKDAVFSDIESIGVPTLTNIHFEYSLAERDVTAISTEGTGADPLRFHVIPAGLMASTNGFRVVAAGTKTGGNGNKTVTFRVNGTVITFHVAANDTNDWRLELYIFNIDDTDVQGISWVGYNGTTILQGYDTAAIDTEAQITMSIFGQCAHEDDVITQTFWLVEHK